MEVSYKSQLLCSLYTSPAMGGGRAAMDRRFTNRLHLLAPMLRLSVELIWNWGRLVGPLNTARGGATTRPNGGGPLGPNVWKIQLPTPQKIALSLIFALGLLYAFPPGQRELGLANCGTLFFAPRSDCAAAMARLFLSMLVLGRYDTTWFYAPGYMWSIIEVSTGITCTCLPTMRVLLKVAFGRRLARFFGMSSRKDGHQRSSNKPWTRSGTTAREAKARVSTSSGHRADDASDSHYPEWEVSSQQILVTDEVNVQLQPVDR
jgi:hypothetical protein